MQSARPADWPSSRLGAYVVGCAAQVHTHSLSATYLLLPTDEAFRCAALLHV